MPIRLVDAAAQLPEAWSSRVLAAFGDARLKLLRMDEAAYPEESHDYDEALLVLDGVIRCVAVKSGWSARGRGMSSC